MFSTAHCGNPGNCAGFTSVDYRKEPFFSGKDKNMGKHPDKFDLACPCSCLRLIMFTVLIYINPVQILLR